MRTKGRGSLAYKNLVRTKYFGFTVVKLWRSARGSVTFRFGSLASGLLVKQERLTFIPPPPLTLCAMWASFLQQIFSASLIIVLFLFNFLAATHCK